MVKGHHVWMRRYRLFLRGAEKRYVVQKVSDALRKFVKERCFRAR